MNILNERLDTLADLGLSHAQTAAPLASNLISGKRFPENGNKRSVSRQEDGVGWLIFGSTLCRDIESNKSLAGTGNPRDETDDFALTSPGFVRDFFDAPGGYRKVPGTSIRTCDGLDGMLSVVAIEMEVGMPR
jgi:hypothetical protein